MVPGPDLWSSATGLAAALGGGLLIGLERERRKRGVEWGPTRPPAGIRSFALAALGGGIAQTLQQPWLVALGAALVAVLVAVAYGASRRPPPPGAPPPDPGLTTELALFVTYLVGVLAVQQPVLGAGAAAVVAGLLAARERLHRFATRALSDAEWHDALVLAALVLVLVPLAPTTPLPWLAGLAPRTLLSLMTLILVLQAAGHVALRLLGPGAGMAGSGALSGFVSSTATIASMGARARAEPALAQACTAGAVFSTAATWVQAMLLLVATAPAAAAALAPSAAAGLLVAAASGAWLLRGAGRMAPGPGAGAGAGAGARARADATAGARPGADADASASAGAMADADASASTDASASSDAGTGADADADAGAAQGPLRLREALLVTTALAAVAAGVTWAQAHFGAAGLLAGTALGALADAHAPVAALGALHAAGQLDAGQVLDGTLVALAANSVTRSITGFVAGGRAYGVRVAATLAMSTGLAVIAAVVFR